MICSKHAQTIKIEPKTILTVMFSKTHFKLIEAIYWLKNKSMRTEDVITTHDYFHFRQCIEISDASKTYEKVEKGVIFLNQHFICSTKYTSLKNASNH